MVSEPPPSPVRLPARYRVGQLLGKGASAKVYEAHDTVLQRAVAIKLLQVEDVQRFLAEAQITSQLEHPYIVPVHDYGQLSDGRPFLVMKRVRGRTLRAAFDEGDLGPLLRRLRLAEQIVQAVAFTHQKGIAHRDLKPANVMIDAQGQVLVMDWGLVRATRDAHATLGLSERPRTMAGYLIGTPGYLPAEAYLGTKAPFAQDVFALGVLLWELLLGSWPWHGDSVAELMFEAQRGAPELPASLDPDLAHILTRCLAPGSARFSHAGDLQDALRAVTEGTARKTRAAKWVQRAQELSTSLADLEAEAERLRVDVKSMEDQLPKWRPLEERLPLHEARARMQTLDVRVAETYGELVSAAERALSQDPESTAAKNLLLSSWWQRYVRAERDRKPSDMALYRQRLLAHGGPEMKARLDATGALTLVTDPPGAEVWCQEWIREGLVWPLSEPVLLGHTPLKVVELAQGSYQLTLKADGKRDTPYPVLIERGEHHDVIEPIRLLSDAEIGGDDWVYVPAGWTWVGGDPEVGGSQLPRARHWVSSFKMGRNPVTIAEYAEFLRHLHQEDPDTARARLPRHDAVEHGRHQPYWLLQADGSLPNPIIDNEGDEWAPDWPVVGIDWHDAKAYGAWCGGGLPSELQWARAFRGADARRFPWGDQFDPNLCWMGWSFRRSPGPQSVGRVRSDVSVFGACHGAGLVREWMGGEDFDGDPSRAPVRGGGWSSTLRACRLGNRFGLEKNRQHTHVGLRDWR